MRYSLRGREELKLTSRQAGRARVGDPISWFLCRADFKKICILFLAVLGLCCLMGFSLVALSGDCFLVVVHGLLTVVISLWEHGL